MDARSLTPFPDRMRLPLRFDAEAMAAECAALGREPWIRHFVTRNYDGDWDVIPLRAPAHATHPAMMIHADPACRDFADTPFLAACPAIRAALSRLPCPLEAVRLMRLGPGSVIREHRDHDLSFEDGAVRLHVPLVTNPGVDFRLNGLRVVMEPGSAWYLRLSDPHSVRNEGSEARVHLVIDARVDSWLAALFAAARAEAA
ncbi:aspartyl/asparaginyl beta-hydroxylase domain-containing protein [Methylobacterium nodulans]|uniref:Aspartyl/Asparaginyl beta-hydroxylase n=1 Tax=Methylobacterium nodulans (strain LMG 21967 / CNCM I-2342 / ORS 2060) TaxID=460265 RepID=B8IH45_METNO|nr:aspartyl/asparaginyl beta-hydroxylase domain-containing protein [Methylobacterium nodulans]ACL59737.1 Aspartyl/Asparaginyl beta-hydroxylase [Methylobacterium nodulans ORS 2060]